MTDDVRYCAQCGWPEDDHRSWTPCSQFDAEIIRDEHLDQVAEKMSEAARESRVYLREVH